MDIHAPGITDRLREIQKRIGGKPVDWEPNARIQIDAVGSGGDIDRLFSESGLLIKNGQPVFVYIRDHTVAPRWNRSAKNRNKIHFAKCRTLIQMQKDGRYQRYRITNRDDDKYLIDVSAGGTRSKEITESLYPCQNCLDVLRYKCFRHGLSSGIKNHIVSSFRAKEAFMLLREHFKIFKAQTTDVKLSTLPAGYPANWAEISNRTKGNRDYICEECRVELKTNKNLLDVHHIDSEKQNVESENLKVLCKLCHAEKHPHYRAMVGFWHRRQILTARKEQGLAKQRPLVSR